METFDKLLKSIKDGLQITFTPDNIAQDDNFLIFGHWRPSITITFVKRGLWYVLFDGTDPMLLEECPPSFHNSILKNLKTE